MATVFVYGTLMADEVVRALIHRVPRARPAVVSGYRRHALRGQVFPGTVPAGATDTVTGKVCVVCVVCVCVWRRWGRGVCMNGLAVRFD